MRKFMGRIDEGHARWRNQLTHRQAAAGFAIGFILYALISILVLCVAYVEFRVSPEWYKVYEITQITVIPVTVCGGLYLAYKLRLFKKK